MFTSRDSDCVIARLFRLCLLRKPRLILTAAIQLRRDSARHYSLLLACSAIHFAPGMSLATIHGTALANTDGSQSVCYSIAVRPGQTVDIVLTGNNVGMTVPEVGDMRDHFHSVTTKRSYALEIGQVVLAPMDTPPYSFTVSVR